MKNDNAVRIGQTTDNINLPGLRDAFHVPAVIVGSAERLDPGQPVRFTNEKRTHVEASHRETMHGIIDPFLDGPLTPGKFCWVFIHHEMAHGLRHVFDILERPYEQEIRKAVTDPVEEDDSCRGCYNDEEIEQESEDDFCRRNC